MVSQLWKMFFIVSKNDGISFLWFQNDGPFFHFFKSFVTFGPPTLPKKLFPKACEIDEI